MDHRVIPAVLVLCLGGLPGSAAAQKPGWEPYQFKGTEHFRFDVQVTSEGETQAGFYTLDLEKKAADKVTLKFKGSLGGNSGEFSTTAPLDQVYGQAMMQMMMSPLGAPLLATLFAPFWAIYFVGQEWEVGSGWSFAEGDQAMSFKIEATCSHAGVSGKKVVWREGNELRAESCIAPEVALPLAVTFRSEDGEVFKLAMTEYRP
jgi:hypothetical protein